MTVHTRDPIDRLRKLSNGALRKLSNGAPRTRRVQAVQRRARATLHDPRERGHAARTHQARIGLFPSPDSRYTRNRPKMYRLGVADLRVALQAIEHALQPPGGVGTCHVSPREVW